jgi:hypothetical protein
VPASVISTNLFRARESRLPLKNCEEEHLRGEEEGEGTDKDKEGGKIGRGESGRPQQRGQALHVGLSLNVLYIPMVLRGLGAERSACYHVENPLKKNSENIFIFNSALCNDIFN